jgi:hypothetical protein
MTTDFNNRFKNIQRALEEAIPTESLSFKASRLIICDTEWCYRSAILRGTNFRRPGGKQFYAIAEIEPFSKWSCCSYAYRQYIEPVKDKITITADDPKIRNAPHPEIVMKCILCYEKLLNAGTIIEMHWANNNCDITAKSDGLAEHNLKGNKNIIHANAMTLVKMLLPGQESYALPNLIPALGFPGYDVHDPHEDCVAAIRCLLYAIHCYLGPDAQLIEDQVNILILNLISEYDLEIVINSSGKRIGKQKSTLQNKDSVTYPSRETDK